MTRLQRSQKKENPKVLELFGYAIGVIGLSVEEFRDLTGEEFAAIATSYEKRQEDAQRGEWERMRLLATIGIQPHIKDKMTPQRLLPFPWDHDKASGTAPEELTMEERRAKAREFLEKLGENG